MKNKNESAKAAILSLSLLTVMAGAAVSPALGGIQAYFRDTNPLLIKMILTVPALFVLITNLFFASITRFFTNKALSIFALTLYVVGGCMGGFVNNIYLLLFFRALLGISVGILMPMSTSLISYYFKKHEQEKLMGYSSAMSQLGGVIVILLSGLLVSISWRYSFMVYFIGIISFVLTLLFMPNEKMKLIEDEVEIYDTIDAEIAGTQAEKGKKESNRNVMKRNRSNNNSGVFRFWIYYLSMGFMMITFYMFPTNFSVIATSEKSFNSLLIGVLMAVQSGAAFIVGMMYHHIKSVFGSSIKFLSATGFISGFSILYFCNSFSLNLAAVILIGLGIGVAIPMLNSEVSKRAKKSEISAALGILSASLYLGQFMAPVFSGIFSSLCGMNGIRSPYIQAILFGIILLIIYIATKIEHVSSDSIVQIKPSH